MRLCLGDKPRYGLSVGLGLGVGVGVWRGVGLVLGADVVGWVWGAGGRGIGLMDGEGLGFRQANCLQ